MKRLTRFLALLVAGHVSLNAFVAERAWRTGDVNYQLHLDASAEKPALPTGGLSDGSANWNAVAVGALNSWNPNLTRIQLKNTTTTDAPALRNNENEITFSAKAYDDDFGTNVLAVTLSLFTNDVQLVETDILVNNEYAWDSYRGQHRNTPIDLRRVLIHEVGHSIGLNHPDEYGQSVNAIMNARVSNVDAVTADDIAGAEALYKTAIVTPTVTRALQSRTVTETDSADLFVETNGGTPPPSSPTLRYNWSYRRGSGTWESLLQPEGRIPLGTVQESDAGTYRLQIATPDGTTNGGSATLTVNPTTTNAATRLYNLSTRGVAGAGNQALIVGFSIKTASTRKLLIRGVGPKLGDFGLTGFIPNPKLELHRASDDALLTSNDTWSTAPGVNASVFDQAGAFRLDGDTTSCAVLVDLPAGNYTAVITPSGTSAAGIGLVEVYDLSPVTTATDRLVNLSTRGFVDVDNRIMVGGLAIVGTQPRTYLFRLVGDSLEAFGVTNRLDDPVLQLKIGTTLARYMDDWDTPESNQDALRAAMTSVGAFSLSDRQESVMLLTLKPGNYTVEAIGLDKTSGVALLEVYEMPNP